MGHIVTIKHGFTDWPEFGGKTYRRGDSYPADGVEVTQEHLEYLAGDQNKFGRPCIIPVVAIEPEESPEAEAPAQVIGMTTPKPKKAPARKKKGITIE